MTRKDEIETVAMLAMAMHAAIESGRIGWDMVSSPFVHAFADAAALTRDARKLHKLAEHDCNYGLTDRQQANERGCQRRIEAVCKRYGWTPKFGGDPRGLVVEIHGTGLPSNCWTTNSFGVA